ncbi:hypothetical protein Bp8pS_160 [Bacillus phage vB_BpuM-BpSp]|nr:hypothetical protein Bp8pS_160 [Bacillus phage vB_BpuM-BpSp]
MMDTIFGFAIGIAFTLVCFLTIYVCNIYSQRGNKIEK